ncbi:hypothetical protein TrVE_jg14337 [Triparma verrucosa]|uniref:Myb-like domain-containing protein n=1 Tax=Triparma verrucosa TaxID=1606542 RepID=A0A9W7BSQ3_9STRA|nr:hypothetical protein TrVE_jg14337 [Triparma verrucosa]
MTSREFTEGEHAVFVDALSEATASIPLSRPGAEVFANIATKIGRPIEEVTSHAYRYFIKLQSSALDLQTNLNPTLSLNLEGGGSQVGAAWTAEDDIRFEKLLTVHPAGEDRWDKIGSAMTPNKPPIEVRQAYSRLLADVFKIECGIDE